VRFSAGLPAESGADLAAGKKIFANTCAACHGETGRGNRDMGAPNLTDAVWLYGSDKATIVDGLWNGRGGVMPAWGNRLDEATIKALTVYVHTFGGGEK
jgi:cytochrome c oxidase cbb3-type subunit 3